MGSSRRVSWWMRAIMVLNCVVYCCRYWRVSAYNLKQSILFLYSIISHHPIHPIRVIVINNIVAAVEQ